jgi:ActR/RegA family two-component response regulator
MSMCAKQQILLVDDDSDLVWGLGRFLIRAGYAVTSCGDGGEAVLILETRSFHALVTDIQMPHVNGLALIEWARQNRPTMRVLVMTAFGSTSLREVVSRSGATLYAEKPVDLDLILRMLRAETRDSFSGIVDDIDLFDYVQLVIATKHQVVMEVISRKGERGQVFFDRGNARHAACGDLVGEAAFFRCLSFEGGTFRSLPWVDPDQATIHRSGEHMLMEAARIKDELSRDKSVQLDEPECDFGTDGGGAERHGDGTNVSTDFQIG